MAVGDTGKWRADGTDTLGTTEGTWSGVQFPTPVGTPGSNFTQNVNDIDIQINETGWYLALYRVEIPDGLNTDRTITRVRALHNSVVIEGSQGTGWMRNANNDHMVADANCMFEVTSTGQNFRIEETRYSETADPQGADVYSVSSEVVLIKLPSEGDVAYGIYVDGTDAGGYATSVWDEIDFDTVDETDTSVIEAQDVNTFRLKKIARYLICYNVTFQDTQRGQRVARMTLAASPIQQSYSHCYLRDTDTDFNTLTAMFIVDNDTINQDVELEVQQLNTNITSGTRVVDESRLCIMELPASTEIVIGLDATGAQETTATGYLNACRTTPEIDAASFTRNDNTTIEVEKADDYLFMCNALLNRASSTGTRSQHGLRWTKNNVDQEVIGMSFIRGLQSTNYTYDGALNGSFMANLAVDDEIEFEFFQAGEGGLGQTVAGCIGMSALNIGTLVSAISDLEIDMSDLVGVVESIIPAVSTFTIAGVTYDKVGTILGSVKCFLCRDNGDNTATFLEYTLSNASTGAYSFTGVGYGTADHFVIFWKDDTPHVMDATDHVLQGV